LASKSERRPVALAPERGKPHDRSRLVHTAQIALAKLGYAVKPDGAEDGATRRALRHFERAHGLAPTTNISPELVKQLAAAAGG
jgi:peptidoglycan hydrolase-like protein with peptidoglycan-binding domain